MYDAAISITEELSVILNRRVPLQFLTDSKSLFNFISKGSRTSKKRTMIDIPCAKEAFRKGNISDIVEKGNLDLHPEQRIIRSKSVH